jgi:hypothetical protein
MARTRSGEDLINDAYLRADLVGATDRHPRASVLRYVNQGGAELYDLLIEARGRAYYAKKPPTTITTTANTSRYALASDFYRLSSVRVGGVGGFTLEPFTPQDEPWLREPGVTASKPTHYELQPGYLELLPIHMPGVAVVVDYVPHWTDLTDSSSSYFDGINGWEQYIVYYAAREMYSKDDEAGKVAEQDRAMAAMAGRIAKLAPGRDSFRAERVKNVRGAGGIPWGWRR